MRLKCSGKTFNSLVFYFIFIHIISNQGNVEKNKFWLFTLSWWEATWRELVAHFDLPDHCIDWSYHGVSLATIIISLSIFITYFTYMTLWVFLHAWQKCRGRSYWGVYQSVREHCCISRLCSTRLFAHSPRWSGNIYLSDLSVPSYHSDKVQYLESGPCLSSQFRPPYHPSTTQHINYLLSSELNLVNVVSRLL